MAPSEFQRPHRQLPWHPSRLAATRIAALVSVLVVVFAAGCTGDQRRGSDHDLGASGSSQSPASPSAAWPSSPPEAAECGGTVLDHRDIRHPHLGMVRVFLVHRADSGSDFNGCVASIAEDNRVLATIDIEIYEDALKFADPATDATGNVFVLYNPGRYDGVLVLVPNEAGFEDIGWGDPALHYRGGRLAYYNAELDGPGEDGRYTIVKSDNPCNPSCAEGATWSVVLRWNGREYLPGE